MIKKPIYFDDVFVEHYKKRVLKDKSLHELYKQALTLFLKNPHSPSLDNHRLKGKMSSKRAFSVDDDCRVIYRDEKDRFLFLDIGSHNQVYK